MKIQLALDDVCLQEAVDIAKEVEEYVDILEIGTPLLMEYGIEAVRTMKKHFPKKEILCDAKIMDGGDIESKAAFKAGADYVTVLGVSDSSTIKAVVKEAKACQKKVVVDLLCLENFEKTIPMLDDLGVDILAVHVGVDQQLSGRTPLMDLIKVKSIAKKTLVAVAGGISSATVAEYLPYEPDIIIVGGAIVGFEKPLEEAKSIYYKIQEHCK